MPRHTGSLRRDNVRPAHVLLAHLDEKSKRRIRIERSTVKRAHRSIKTNA